MIANVVSLAALAKQIGWERRRLYRHLLRLNAELGGLVLIKAKGRGTRTMVNRAALEHFESLVTRSIEERVTECEAQGQSLEKRVTALEVRLSEAI